MRIQKAVNHPDSCFLNKKQRKQLTSICLQLPQPQQQQQELEAASTVADAVAAGKQIQVAELKTILKKAGLDVEGLKLTLLQRVHKANLMHHLENSRAAETLLKNYKVMHGRVGAEDAFADKEEAAAAAEETAANREDASAETAAETAAEPAAETAAEPSAEPSAETVAEPSAEPAAKPGVDTALPHISNFYTTSTEDNNVRIWDLDAWQDMLKDKCPELHLVPTEGDMTWDTEMMPLMVANTLPTGYTPAVHQFLAEHFDYGRNLVVIDLLSVKKAHSVFMILLCNEEERACVAESERVADDGSIASSGPYPHRSAVFL